LNGKCEAHFLKKKNPRKFNWTVVYRRLHKKGAAEAVAKKKSRRIVKAVRGFVGLASEELKAKRTQPVEDRAAARAEAVEAAKAAKKEKQQKKKLEKVKIAGANMKPKAVKIVKASKPQAHSR
jgi:large subunit ribosomal protein L24e